MKKILTLVFISLSLIVKADMWTQIANFGGEFKFSAAAFSIGNYGYTGTGAMDISGDSVSKEFWRYDPSSNSWTQMADFGGAARYCAVGFSIDSMGYIGTGEAMTYSGVLYNDFWQYNPQTNTWSQKANFGGGFRMRAVGISIGHKGYIGTGMNYSGLFTNDFWEYDPVTDTWTQKADFGGHKREYATGFSIGNIGYLGTGYYDTTHNFSVVKDFWAYDPSLDTWTQKADVGDTGRCTASSFVINNKGYIGLGAIYFGWPFADFWEYDPIADSWTQKTSCPVKKDNSVSFSINNKGYVGVGHDSTALRVDFWKYDSNAWSGIPELTNQQNQLITLSPNPSIGTFYLSINSQENADLNIEITDILGQRIWAENQKTIPATFTQDFDLSNKPQGVYFISIKLGATSLNRKIVVMR